MARRRCGESRRTGCRSCWNQRRACVYVENQSDDGVAFAPRLCRSCALRLANCLAPGSTLVTYGAMSLQPLKIPNGLLIFKDLRFRGIWINKWYDHATPAQRMEAFEHLFEIAKRGLLQTKVEKAYPLSE